MQQITQPMHTQHKITDIQHISNMNLNNSSTTKLNNISVDEIDKNGSKQLQINDDLNPHQIAKDLTKVSDDLKLDVEFQYNQEIDTLYINIMDKKTGEIISKFPTEDAMKIKENMKKIVGIIFDKKG